VSLGKVQYLLNLIASAPCKIITIIFCIVVVVVVVGPWIQLLKNGNPYPIDKLVAGIKILEWSYLGSGPRMPTKGYLFVTLVELRFTRFYHFSKGLSIRLGIFRVSKPGIVEFYIFANIKSNI
jgi:hypothetical protein